MKNIILFWKKKIQIIYVFKRGKIQTNNTGVKRLKGEAKLETNDLKLMWEIWKNQLH